MSNLPFRSTGACARSAVFVLLSLFLPSAAIAQQAAEDEPIALEEISVTANRIEGPAAAIGSAVSSISGDELDRRQVRVVSDALRELPGVAVNRTGPVGAPTQIRLRGSEGNQTLVMIDGVRVNDPATSSEFDFANLLNLEVERVDVLRGPQSALYGSDAIGGVVNIVTRRGEGKPMFRGAVEGGSFGTVTASASLSGGSEAYDYLFAGQGFRTDGVSIASPRFGGSERDGYENATGLAKVAVRPNEILEISAVTRLTRFDAERDGFGVPTGESFARAIDNGDHERGDQFFGRVQAKATLLDGAWDHVLGLSRTDQKRRSFDDADAQTYASKGWSTRLDYQSNIRFETGATLPASHVLTAGADRQWDATAIESTFLARPTKKDIGSTGLVGQYQLGLFQNLFLTASVRQDFNDRFEDATTWRFAGAYTVEATETKLRASYGTGVKNPTLSELFGFSGNFRGNPDLTPEKGEGWDVGVDQTLLDGRVTLDATYFQQRVTDLISSAFRPDGMGGGVNVPINLPGKSAIDGVELGLTLRPFDPLTVRAAYTFTDGEDARGLTLVRRPRHVGSVNLDYAFPKDKANVNVGLIYNGRQRDLLFDANFASRQVALDPYVLVNVAASYKVTENAEVFGRVENLFDEEYEEVFTYGAPGRAAYGGVKVSF